MFFLDNEAVRWMMILIPIILVSFVKVIDAEQVNSDFLQ